MRLLLWIASVLLAGAPALAEGVALKSDVFVQKTIEVDGVQKTVLETPVTVVPGDTLVFVLSYRNESAEPVTGFELNNPLPKAVSYVDQQGPEALVSIDEGKTFGRLTELKVPLEDGSTRPAEAADVTNLRWKFDRAIAVNEAGELRFTGKVK